MKFSYQIHPYSVSKPLIWLDFFLQHDFITAADSSSAFLKDKCPQYSVLSDDGVSNKLRLIQLIDKWITIPQ